MQIVFSKIFSDNPDNYLKEKLRRIVTRNPGLAAQLDDKWMEAKVGSVVSGLGKTSVPIALADSFYPVTPEQEAEIEARKRCTIVTLLRDSPLVTGETIQEDFFTFLKKPFGGAPADTVVLRRTTSAAEIFYLFEDVQVVKGELQYIERVPFQPEPPVSAFIDPDTIKGLAKTLGEGLLSGFAGSVAALIFDKIFPPGIPDYFGEVFKEIKTIVKQEIMEAKMADINGRVNGVVAWSKIVYRPRKESNPPPPRKDLFDDVNEQVKLLYTEAVYTLMEERYAKPGLPAFMVAAGVHLALMQELALVDPIQPDPNKSSYAKSIALSAQEYHDHAVRTFDAIVKDRQNAVVIRFDPLTSQDPGDPNISVKPRYRWSDPITGREGVLHEQYMDKDKKYHSGKEEAEADRQSYLPGITAQLTASLSFPKVTAAEWLKLKAQPIPKLSAAHGVG